MNDPIVSEPLPGLAVPPAIQACFPNSDPEVFPAYLMPVFLQSRCFETCGTQLGVCAVAAATLQVAAVALGGYLRLEVDGDRTMSSVFNLCHAVPDSARDAGIIESVIAPLRERIQTYQTWGRQQDEAALTRRIHMKTAELQAAGRTVSPNPELVRRIGLECAGLDGGLTPEMLFSRLTVLAFEGASEKSLDRSLLYVAEGVDPTDAWEALPRTEREDLARQLNLSWDAAHVSASGAPPVNLNVIWVTAMSCLPALYANRELFDCGRPVPMLLLAVGTAPPSRLGADAISQWDERVGKMLDLRLLKRPRLYKFCADADEEFADFRDSFRQRLAGLPFAHRKHLAYLPDLVRRIALLCAIFEDANTTKISPEALSSGIELAEWFGMAHATALSEIPVVDGKPVRTDSAARPDKKPDHEVMLAKITLKAPVTRRVLWNSYNKPTRDGFQPVLDALLVTGKVRWLDKIHLVPGDWEQENGGVGAANITPKNGNADFGCFVPLTPMPSSQSSKAAPPSRN